MTQLELNLKPRTKRDKFLDWCKSMKVVSGVMATQWGLDNYYKRADRQLRKFAQDEICERLNLAQKLDMGLMRPWDTEIAWFQFRG